MLLQNSSADIQLDLSGATLHRVQMPEVIDSAYAYDLLRFFEGGEVLPHRDFETLLSRAAVALSNEPSVACLPRSPGGGGTVTVVGDLHGSLGDLSKALSSVGTLGPNNVVIFNGDFVDRGTHSVEVS